MKRNFTIKTKHPKAKILDFSPIKDHQMEIAVLNSMNLMLPQLKTSWESTLLLSFLRIIKVLDIIIWIHFPLQQETISITIHYFLLRLSELILLKDIVVVRKNGSNKWTRWQTFESNLNLLARIICNIYSATCQQKSNKIEA